ncbi:MAG: flagellar hook-length control protein FliK [Pusillimonas sp.]|nr:flagellar hook-length control protein FliK [Pusillimonas sp.]
MSVNGPSGLGTLLVQRLDAVLGTTLSQQTNLVNGARPDAIAQTPEAQRNEAVQNRVARETREAIDQVQRHGERATRQAVERTKVDALKSLPDERPDQPSTRTTASAPTTLGTAARAILALLQNFPEQQAAVVRGRQPLIQPQGQATRSAANTPNNAQNTPSGQGATQARGASPSPQAQVSSQALAQTLSQTVQSSGLFYESHLSALSFGKYPASALRQEPQALLNAGSNTSPVGAAQASASSLAANNQSTAPTGATSSQAPQTATAATGPNQVNANASPVRVESGHAAQQTSQGNASSDANSTTSSGVANNSGSGAAGSSTALAALHPDTHAIVRQQLEVLANQGFLWKGEAWAGTDLEMHIQRRNQEESEQNDDSTHWSTHLKLALPHLGNIDVRLSLKGPNIQMAIVAPESASVLKQHTSTLHERLNLAGLQLAHITVAQQPAMENNHGEQANFANSR